MADATAAHGPSTVAAVLVAGGSGTRLGAPLPKAFVAVGGRTLLDRAAEVFARHPAVGELVVVAPSDYLDAARAEVTPGTARTVVVGGDTRQRSVRAGLAALDPAVAWVLVHDVARPFVPPDVIDRVLAALWAGADAAVPVVAVPDTIRRIGPDGAFAGVVDRDELVAVQTPQGFRRAALDAAHTAGALVSVTDDAALVEAAGGTVVPVAGADESFKITRPWDLRVAQSTAEAADVAY